MTTVKDNRDAGIKNERGRGRDKVVRKGFSEEPELVRRELH